MGVKTWVGETSNAYRGKRERAREIPDTDEMGLHLSDPQVPQGDPEEVGQALLTVVGETGWSPLVKPDLRE